jgi:hypothetical protein
MNIRRLTKILLSALAGVGCLAGCGTISTNVVKSRGVYTALATAETDADQPAADHTSCKTFAPDQTPAAVVTGYGYWGDTNRPQPFELEVVETVGHTIVFSREGNAYAGRVASIELPIRESGDYQVRLIINDSVADAWDFSVKRDAALPGVAAPAGSPAAAKDDFEVVVSPWSGGDLFKEYDDDLGATLTAAVKEARKRQPDLFAPGTPGHAVIRFDLDETGQVTAPQLIMNTLDDARGQFFLGVFQAGAPYKAWPAACRIIYGGKPRPMKVTFYLR